MVLVVDQALTGRGQIKVGLGLGAGSGGGVVSELLGEP